jgi:receptor protein-tyrosine kinase
VRILDTLSQDWVLSTEVHKLESRLWRQSREEGLHVILVTSAVRGEGKSTMVACLAASMSLSEGRRILAVDFDFRIPQLNEHFNLDIEWGIAEILQGQCTLDDAIIHTEISGLDVLLPSRGEPNPSSLLQVPKLKNEFRILRDRYDVILIDAPAVLPVADTSGLIPLSDGVILMVLAGKSTGPQFRRARELCLGMGANLIGVVVGNVQEAIPDYMESTYHHGYPAPGSGRTPLL